jgi:hypothetical protein
MPISTAVGAVANPEVNRSAVAQIGLTTNWQTIISAGGMTVQDAASITSPGFSITSATRVPMDTRGMGSGVIFRLRYDSTLATITNPVIKVFGKTGPNGAYQLLRLSGGLTYTLTTAATDADNSLPAVAGTFKYTTPNLATDVFNCAGNSIILVGIETILAGTVGSVATATLEAKIVSIL